MAELRDLHARKKAPERFCLTLNSRICLTQTTISEIDPKQQLK